MTLERRKQWNFLLGEDGSWLWRVVNPDDTEAASQRSFATLKECTEDAARNDELVRLKAFSDDVIRSEVDRLPAARHVGSLCQPLKQPRRALRSTTRPAQRARSSIISPAVACALPTTPGMPAPGWVPAPTK